ncbi:BTAD domain-containing putative transcriptional regulator [Actinoplanes sp. N902-109]|uniref:AfsR/SARP family transcriptional regulator n=1 Tax=Actinoplanes sp. (strain N902-109) TaxID=649831 RepID=UPI0003295FAB|nr:BTAD domain-containing putative transcriptional regulator [Actinoplanes sp. N902-109]AGL17010.1 SARP family transcriptional regulator [Actinoplanes sp. N902-109]
MADHARSRRLAREANAGSHWPAHPRLAAHVLGSFIATVDGAAVRAWHGGRIRSLFAYLLTHRSPCPSREVLMDVFWPKSTPEAARNSLNVALHGVRRALRTVTERPVVSFHGNSYGLDPDVRLWLDVDEFDRHLRLARCLELAGRSERAIREYEVADGLYRGDFLADNPYEEWCVLLRDRLRLAHVDALDHLSGLSFEVGRYAAAATLCSRIIEYDPCRETAHRRLMHCHSRQGQPHLALLQHQACVSALRSDLDMDPSPETQDLYRRIRRHESV